MREACLWAAMRWASLRSARRWTWCWASSGFTDGPSSTSTTSITLCTGGEPGDADPSPEVRIEVVLTDLSAEAQRRFAGHLRPWSAELNEFTSPADLADASSGATANADDDGQDTDLAAGDWCLPVVFLGRFNPDEDDFEGNTFFAHPQRAEGDYDLYQLGGSRYVVLR